MRVMRGRVGMGWSLSEVKRLRVLCVVILQLALLEGRG